MKKALVKTFLLAVFCTFFYVGSSIIETAEVGSATRYDITPTYNLNTYQYAVPYQNRGGTYSSLTVQKYGGSDSKISANYWVSHTSSKVDQRGTQMMYNPNLMSLAGYYEPCSTCAGQKMQLNLTSTSDGLRWLRAEGYIDPGNYGQIGYSFSLVNTTTYFNHTKMDGVTRHALFGPSVGYTLSWGSPLTRVYGNSMLIYKN